MNESILQFDRLAVPISGGIVVFMIYYWIVQIAGVARMLKLAYG